MKRNKKIEDVLFFSILISIFLFFILGIMIYQASPADKSSYHKETYHFNQSIYSSPGTPKISFEDFNGSVVIYKNVFLKLINGKLQTIASLGIQKINNVQKREIINAIKDFENADKADFSVCREIAKHKKFFLISNENFYIFVYKTGNKKCYVYKVTNNTRTKMKCFEYCNKN